MNNWKLTIVIDETTTVEYFKGDHKLYFKVLGTLSDMNIENLNVKSLTFERLEK